MSDFFLSICIVSMVIGVGFFQRAYKYRNSLYKNQKTKITRPLFITGLVFFLVGFVPVFLVPFFKGMAEGMQHGIANQKQEKNSPFIHPDD